MIYQWDFISLNWTPNLNVSSLLVLSLVCSKTKKLPMDINISPDFFQSVMHPLLANLQYYLECFIYDTSSTEYLSFLLTPQDPKSIPYTISSITNIVHLTLTKQV